MTPAARLMLRLDALAAFSDEAGMLTRLFLSPSHKVAAAQLLGWMEEAGMAARLDAIGTVRGRYEGALPGGPALLIGSHVDTVRDAGKYDGNLGVLLGIAVVEELHRRGERLPFAIEVIGFGDEEGVRFPVTLTGARALAGTFREEWLEAADGQGITLRRALGAFGCDPAAIPALALRRADVLAYLEVHIEQGPVLDRRDLPLGLVTATFGASRLAVTVTGEAGHAGTVPMALRRDALAGAAEMILAIEARARAEPDLVATVGRIEVLPGAVNVIPGSAAFSLDIRALTDERRLAVLDEIEQAARRIAEKRGLAVTFARAHEAPATPCDPLLMEGLAASIARQGLDVLRLPSGAGHDAMAMAALCPVAMLFTRCRAGVSHNPAESIREEDAAAALAVMLDFLRHFQPEPFRQDFP